MTLPGFVTDAPPGSHGFDTSGVLDKGICETAKARGFSFCLRYVSRSEQQSMSDLSEAEARTILRAGLALMPVQHVAREGWSPKEGLGATYGRNAAMHALQIGFPPGVNLWLDLEGIKPSIAHQVVIDYCNAWFAEVASARFVPGVYVGARALLSGDELFWRLQTRHYWRSGSRVPDIPHRGYQMIQKIIKGDNLGGIDIDRNLTLTDKFGGSVFWLAPKDSLTA